MTHRVLTRPDEIAAYVHETRLKMLTAFCEGPATVTQVAERLSVHPANLTRHVRILVEAGLLELVEKRDTGRNLEKLYATTAYSFEVAPDAAELKAPHRIALAYARSVCSAALARIGEDDNRPMKTMAIAVRLNREGIAELEAALDDIVTRFGERREDTEDGEHYTILLGFFPDTPNTGPDSPPRIVLERKPSSQKRKKRNE